MEALLFMLNSIAVVLMVFMGLRDDRLPPGMPHTSLFRLRDEPVAAAAKPPIPEMPAASDPAGSAWADWDRAGSRPQ